MAARSRKIGISRHRFDGRQRRILRRSGDEEILKPALSQQERISLLCAATVIVVAFLVLIGGNDPVTPFLAILCGISLVFLVSRKAPKIQIVLSGIPACIGYAKTISYALNSSWPIAANVAPNSAVALLLAGSCLILLERRSYWYAQTFAFFALLIGWGAFLGYLYSSAKLYQVSSFIPMSLHTSVMFIFLSVGLLNARPR